MSNENSAPLWLDLKTEYIDDNFESVLKYLQRSSYSSEKDAFYKVTIDLLKKRVEEVIKEVSEYPLYSGVEDQEHLAFQTRLIAAYILTKGEENLPCEVLMAFLETLALQSKPENVREIFAISMPVFCGLISCIKGFSWSDVTSYSPQIFVCKVIRETKKDNKAEQACYYENHGILVVEKGKVRLYPCCQREFCSSRNNFVSSISLANDVFQVLSRQDDKLKQSDSSNYQKIDSYTKETLGILNDIHPTPLEKRRYSDDEIIDVEIISIDQNCIMLRTINPNYESITGPLDEESVFFYQINDYKKYLREGDFIPVKLSQKRASSFSIVDTLKEFLLNYYNYYNECLAVAKTVEQNKIVWWTEYGFPVYSNPAVKGVSEGDFATIQITNKASNGYIQGRYVEHRDDKFDVEESKDMFLSSFVYDKSSYSMPTPEFDMQAMSQTMVRMLCSSMYFYQKSLSSMIERYRYLTACKFLAALTEDTVSLGYISFVSDYLRNLAFFAQGKYDDIKPLEPKAEFESVLSARRKVNTIEVLMNYGKKDDNGLLDRVIEDDESLELARIAKLVQSCNRISDVVSSAMLNSIKREITKSLSADSENEGDLDEDNGIYLGMEDRLREFKSSFVYPPAQGMTANLSVQSKNIFKGLCAFLNSELGGTLYLGVSDIGYVTGIDQDLKYLKKNHDAYIRLIQDEAKKYFDIDVIDHWDFKLLYDGKVVAINVHPYEYGVVEFNGNAYIRLTGESVQMSEAHKNQLLSKRILPDKDKVKNLARIQSAIREERIVILHNYSSSHSGVIADRRVEPFYLDKYGTSVWCYDIDSKDNKVFSISRIGYVSILEDKWVNKLLHKKLKTDIFHLSGEKGINVTLQLDLMAKNLICEEYPESKNVIKKMKDSDNWTLNTEVYKIEGIGRFYIGLAEHIKIINAPELKEYAKAYFERMLKEV